jgi:hypothetical protein
MDGCCQGVRNAEEERPPSPVTSCGCDGAGKRVAAVRAFLTAGFWRWEEPTVRRTLTVATNSQVEEVTKNVRVASGGLDDDLSGRVGLAIGSASG